MIDRFKNKSPQSTGRPFRPFSGRHQQRASSTENRTWAVTTQHKRYTIGPTDLGHVDETN